ncbi:hypothetical protein DdX_03790 [Ditylenchus destructor]|uniref:Uncharacterized protein n=1 Tax=Ditylenchus destructor TaxID=166010 RepID=A0AAD4RBB3_9BILA|nr:hypothetical protein DdX_03790 [Ditylenchus destructor]
MIYWRAFILLCLYTAFAFSDDECVVSVGRRRQFIPPGCQFCNGAAGEVSEWAECRNGQNRLQSCPKDQVCLGQGQCQISCGKKDDGGGDNGGDSGEVVQCGVLVGGKRQLIPPECQFCNSDAEFATCRDGQNMLTNCPHQTKWEAAHVPSPGIGSAPEFRRVANSAAVRIVTAGANVTMATSTSTAADADNVAVRTGLAALTAIKRTLSTKKMKIITQNLILPS